MFADAIAELRQSLSGSGGGPHYVSALGHAYAISGQKRIAEQSLARLTEQSKQRYVAPYDMAEIYIGLAEKEQALKYLEMAYQDRSCWMTWLAESGPAVRSHTRRSPIPGSPAPHASHSLMHATGAIGRQMIAEESEAVGADLVN